MQRKGQAGGARAGRKVEATLSALAPYHMPQGSRPHQSHPGAKQHLALAQLVTVPPPPAPHTQATPSSSLATNLSKCVLSQLLAGLRFRAQRGREGVVGSCPLEQPLRPHLFPSLFPYNHSHRSGALESLAGHLTWCILHFLNVPKVT